MVKGSAMKGFGYSTVLIVLLMTAASTLAAEEGASLGDQETQGFVPGAGLVPDEQTAIAIAKAVWLPMYGDTLEDEAPFNAELVDGVWHVSGTPSEGWSGGVPEAEIKKSNGRFVRITFGQ